MATYSFTGFSTSDFRMLTGWRARVDPDYDSATAYTFEVTDDDASWSGDSTTDQAPDDTTQQTTIVRNGNGDIVASGRSYLESAYTGTDECGRTTTVYQIMIGARVVGYVADGPVQPGNTYTYSSSNVTPSNEPSYAGLISQRYDPDANNKIRGTSDADSIHGGAGNDYISSNDGNDTVFGGAGNDQIRGGSGNDSIDGGDDWDTIYAGDGNDTSLGGEGDDYIDGQAGNDFLDGGAGNDEVRGGAGDDSVLGGGGNDIVDGGAGNDVVEGGAGDDTLSGGAGNDTISGGTGNDVFEVSDGTNTITDFNTGNTGTLNDGVSTNNDFIDLSGYYDNLSELYADQADDEILNQSNTIDTKGRSTDYSDNQKFGSSSMRMQGASADNSSFTQENTGVVCFASGTAIRTPSGDVLIDELCVGDLVTTLDNGPQRIRWIGRRVLDRFALQANPNMRPILVRRGVLGVERDLLVSPQHGLLVGRCGDQLARAKHLAQSMPGVRVATGKRSVTYIHLMFDAHQIILSESAASESFYPGPMALQMMESGPRSELFNLFPELSVATHDKQKLRDIYGHTSREFLPRKMVATLAR